MLPEKKIIELGTDRAAHDPKVQFWHNNGQKSWALKNKVSEEETETEGIHEKHSGKQRQLTFRPNYLH